MKTSDIRNLVKSMNLSGVISLDFNRRYNNENKNYHVVIGDQMLSFETSKEQISVFNILSNKFGFTKKSELTPFISESERGYFDGWASDMRNPKCHGSIVYSILSSDKDGGVYCWDYYKQQIVKKSELTNI